MRLTPYEITVIQKSFAFIQSHHQLIGKLYLFGSRTDDQKKGGDIDLLWILPESYIKKAYALKLDLLAQIKMSLDDQKIDLTLLSEEEKDQLVFYQSIKNSLVQLG